MRPARLAHRGRPPPPASPVPTHACVCAQGAWRSSTRAAAHPHHHHYAPPCRTWVCQRRPRGGAVASRRPSPHRVTAGVYVLYVHIPLDGHTRGGGGGGASVHLYVHTAHLHCTLGGGGGVVRAQQQGPLFRALGCGGVGAGWASGEALSRPCPPRASRATTRPPLSRCVIFPVRAEPLGAWLVGMQTRRATPRRLLAF